MGLLIGASVITVVEILDLVFYNCARKGCRQRPFKGSKLDTRIESIPREECCAILDIRPKHILHANLTIKGSSKTSVSKIQHHCRALYKISKRLHN